MSSPGISGQLVTHPWPLTAAWAPVMGRLMTVSTVRYTSPPHPSPLLPPTGWMTPCNHPACSGGSRLLNAPRRHALFQAEGKLAFEGCPFYLGEHLAPVMLQRVFPRLKVMAVLRNPRERTVRPRHRGTPRSSSALRKATMRLLLVVRLQWRLMPGQRLSACPSPWQVSAFNDYVRMGRRRMRKGSWGEGETGGLGRGRAGGRWVGKKWGGGGELEEQSRAGW